MNGSAIQQEALGRATSSPSMANYSAIYAGFIAKGISEGEIEPRVNVFTFHAWKALGRSVKKGEHGVKVCTWISMTKKDAAGDAQPIGKKPRMTTVFHVSQTQATDAPADSDSDADTGANAEVQTDGSVILSAEWIEAHAEKSDPRPIVKPAPDYFSQEFTETGRA